jgi:neutral ceramidase
MFSLTSLFRQSQYLVLLAIAVTWQPTHSSAETSWQAGLASEVITPNGSMWMAGYASRTKPAEGKIHDLYAKAIALESPDKTRLVIVTLDLISIPYLIRDYLEAEVKKRFDLSPAGLLMNCSHTHCGPEIRTTRWSDDGLPSERLAAAKSYVTFLKSKLVQVVEQAIEDLQLADVSFCRARCGFAMNRRLPSPNGYRNFPNPNGPVDHDVPVLRIRSAAGKLRGILFGYACHNTTLGLYQFCGDFAGFAQLAIEKTNPGALALYMQGCGADINPYPRSTLELAKQHGQSLATAVQSALETEATPLVGELRTSYGKATVEYSTPPTKNELVERTNSSNKYVAIHGQRLLTQLANDGHLRSTYDCPIQVVQLGDKLKMIALPGETVVDYALRIKSDLTTTPDPGASVWVAGYCNDVFAYVPSRRVLLEGGYEAGDAMKYFTTVLQHGPFAQNIEEIIVRKVYELNKSLQK